MGDNESVVGDGEIGVGAVPLSGSLGGSNPGAVPIQMLLLSSPGKQKPSDAQDADVRKPGSPEPGKACGQGVPVVFGYGSGCALRARNRASQLARDLELRYRGTRFPAREGRKLKYWTRLAPGLSGVRRLAIVK